MNLDRDKLVKKIKFIINHYLEHIKKGYGSYIVEITNDTNKIFVRFEYEKYTDTFLIEVKLDKKLKVSFYDNDILIESKEYFNEHKKEEWLLTTIDYYIDILNTKWYESPHSFIMKTPSYNLILHLVSDGDSEEKYF